MSKFSPTNIIKFKLNDIEYALHRHMIEDWAIFGVLSDCEVDTLELTWNANPKNVDAVFSFICEYDFDLTHSEHISTCVEVISFMRYLGISETLINEMVDNMTSDKTIPECVNESCSIVYDDCILPIFDVVLEKQVRKLSYHNDMYQRICDAPFPAHSKIHILRKILVPRINRLIYVDHLLIESSCKKYYPCDVHPKCDVIKIYMNNIYKEYGFDIPTFDIHRNFLLNSYVIISGNCYLNEKGILDIPRTVLEHILIMMQARWTKK